MVSQHCEISRDLAGLFAFMFKSLLFSIILENLRSAFLISPFELLIKCERAKRYAYKKTL